MGQTGGYSVDEARTLRFEQRAHVPSMLLTVPFDLQMDGANRAKQRLPVVGRKRFEGSEGLTVRSSGHDGLEQHSYGNRFTRHSRKSSGFVKIYRRGQKMLRNLEFSHPGKSPAGSRTMNPNRLLR